MTRTVSALQSSVRPTARVRIDWLFDLAAGLLALLGYWTTLAPTITWSNSGADSGDLVTAAFTLGIPHPPGYPLYTLIAAGFAHLPFSEPARNVGLFSALSAAIAVVLISQSARRLIATQSQNWITALVPPSVALVFAFAPLFWSQSNIAEIYAFSILIVSALVLALLSESRYRLFFAALPFGLGLAHHLTIVLMLPTAIVLLADTRWTRREIFLAFTIALAPLLFYLYLPLRAAAQPPVNWGDPRTLGGFGWMVSGAPYHAYLFGATLSELSARVALAAQSLFDQFKVWGVALGLWGIAQMAFSQDRKMQRRLLALALGFLFAAIYAVVYVTRNSFVYLLPAFLIFVLWIAYGLADLASRMPARWGMAVAGIALIFLPAFNFISNYSAVNVSQDRTAYAYAQNVFAVVPNDAVVLADGDEHLFALWYYRNVVAHSSSVVVVSSELLQYDWYYNEVRAWLPYARATVIGQAAAPDRARAFEIINRTLETNRAVYTTAPRDWLARYVYRQQGDLFWILDQKR
jgi:Protein O-mannosyl-transferase TMEM260-like